MYGIRPDLTDVELDLLDNCGWSWDCTAIPVKPVALILLACFALGGPAVDSSFAQTDDDKRIKQLENERKKLSSTKDPADRAESLMKIADITLTYVGDAVAANDLENSGRLWRSTGGA